MKEKETSGAYSGLKIMSNAGVHEAVTEEIQKRVKKGGRILDIGAGEGALSQRLHDLGYNVTSIDVCEENFKPVNIKFIKFNVEKKLHEIINEKFDCIIAVEVIEHLYNPSQLFDSATFLLKENAVFIVTTPNIASLVSIHSLFRHATLSHYHHRDLWEETGHVSPISIFQLQNLAIDYGFTTEEIMAVGDLSLFNFRTGLFKGFILGIVFSFLKLFANQYANNDNIIWVGEYSSNLDDEEFNRPPKKAE